MINIEIHIGKKKSKIDFPEKWDELTDVQFVFLVSKMANYKQNELNIINFLIGMLNDPLFDWPQEIKDLVGKLIFSEPEPKIYIPRLDTWYGPRDYFRNVTVIEFAFADTYFSRYLNMLVKQNNGEIVDADAINIVLNKFIACLYRPEAIEPTTADYREKFDENLIDDHAVIVKHFNSDYKNAIVFNYQIIRNWLEQKYVHVFDSEELKTESGERRADSSGMGWDKFMRALCFGDLTKLDKVGELLLLNVLSDADERILESKKAKK